MVPLLNYIFIHHIVSFLSIYLCFTKCSAALYVRRDVESGRYNVHERVGWGANEYLGRNVVLLS